MSHLLQIMITSHLHFFGRHSSLFTLNSFPLIFPNLSDLARWPLRLLPHLSRFKNQFSSVSSRCTSCISPSTSGNGLATTQHLFPTLNRHLYPVPKYGTNQKAYDRTTLILPTPLLMLYTFPHLTSLKKKPSWMSCWNPIFQNHINMLLLRHLIPFQILRSFLPRHRHLRSASRKPKQLPKHQSNVVATTSSRDSGPLAP